MEKINIIRQDPYWVHGMNIVIANSKLESLADEMGDVAPIRVYSDGSGLEGRIGAVPVLFRQGEAAWTRRRRKY